MKRAFSIKAQLAGYIPALFKARPYVRDKALRIVLYKLLQNNVAQISAREAALNRDEFIFLDSREYEEYAVSHIAAAKFVGYNTFDIHSLDIPTDASLVVYCSVGKRSEDIVMQLKQQGYNKVYNLYGGLFEWKNQGYDVYDLQNQPTNNVHVYTKLWGRFLITGVKIC
jgi:rhodanese-related sulfurtransferase